MEVVVVGNEEGSPKKSLESLFETSSRQGGRDEDEIFFFLLFPDAAFPLFSNDRTAWGSGLGLDRSIEWHWTHQGVIFDRPCMYQIKMYYLTDSDIRVPDSGEERAVWAIIVLQSASRARGCDEPLIARLSLLLDHRAVVIQSLCHHWTRQPPSFEFDALWQVLKRIKWRVSTVLWIRTPTPRALLLSSRWRGLRGCSGSYQVWWKPHMERQLASLGWGCPSSRL